jgi:hypothetical protein
LLINQINASVLLYNQVERYGGFMSKNIIGKKVREARLKSKPKITQRDLLARLELREIYMNDTAISKIEAGTRPVSDKELVAVADALRVTPHWLLGIEAEHGK